VEAAPVRIAVFGYASLVSTASAGQTLGRPISDPIPARLDGWARGWTLGREQAASEKTFARPDGSVPCFCLGLNLDPTPDAPAPNGVLIELSAQELDRLDIREIRYRRVDVTEEIAGKHGFDRVVTYVARPEHHHPAPPEDAVVIAAYPATVEAAFDSLGPGQLELFRETTTPIPVEVVAGATLVRDGIPEGNPRDW
jgi:hypothetical protein